jgi:hypothetical protein
MKILDAWKWAELAYHPEDLPDTAIRMEHGHDSGFYILLESGELVVSFQGTGTLSGDPWKAKVADWLSNMNAADFNGNGIHDGFDSALKPFLRDLEPVLGAIRPTRLILTGHSRGGALAGLTAYHMGLPCDVITFGAPAQGNREYVNACNMMPLNWINVVNDVDCVPTYPPQVLGYRHAGRTIALKGPLWHRFYFVRRYWRIKCHLPDSYTAGLRREFSV